MKASTHTNAPKAAPVVKLRKKRIKIQTATAAALPITIVERKPSVRDVVRDRLYSREGGEAFHNGNPFAVLLNQALNA